MDEVLAIYMRKLESKGVSVHKQYSDSDEVIAYPGEVRQIFSNLIGNAIDAMNDGGCVSVKIANSRAWRKAGLPGVRATIFDSGTGIDPAIKPRLFEPFYTTKTDIGTGLGLWLAKELIQKHGGSISVHSSIRTGSSGTAFSVFLPTNPPALKQKEAA
jgi:two-component system CheB/CheR fusion protein